MKLAFRFLLLYTKSKRALFCVKLIVGFNLTNENCPDSMISASLHFTHIFKTCVSACEFLIFSGACLYATSVNVTSILSVVYIIYLGISLVHSFPSSLLLYTSPTPISYTPKSMSKASISLSVTTIPSVSFLYLFLPLWQQFLN